MDSDGMLNGATSSERISTTITTSFSKNHRKSRVSDFWDMEARTFLAAI